MTTTDNPVPPDAAADKATEPTVVFYDGDCGLCHASVRFAMARDREGRVRFAPLFGETYRAARAAIEDPAVNLDDPPDSLLLVRDGRVLIRSRAVSALLRLLDPPWPLLGRLLAVVPAPLADLGYRTVAALRRLLFAAPEGVCPLVPPEQRSRFLP